MSIDTKHLNALAWLASRENRDADLRQQAKEVLDKLCFIEQLNTLNVKPKCNKQN